MPVALMAKWPVQVKLVLVPTARSAFRHIPVGLEIAYDLRDGSFGDSDDPGDVAQAGGRIGGDALEDAPVVRHEPPLMIVFSGT
jgi:hypothetical protein